MATYNALRFLISEQPGLFIATRDKKEIFHEILNSIVEKRRDEYYTKGTRHIFFYVQNINKDIYAFQFAREERENVPKEIDNMIQYIVDIRLPNINLIIDWKRQIFLIENKPSVFPNIDSLKRKLEEYFDREFKKRTDTQYKISLSEISRDIDFWKEISDAERIYSLELSFNPPNLFEGRYEANELVRDAYAATKFSQFKLKFINNKGQLKLLKENLKNFISLIASGGGSYVANMVKHKGHRRIKKRINSKYFASQQTLPDLVEQIKEKELVEKLEKLDHQNESPRLLGGGEEVNLPNLKDQQEREIQSRPSRTSEEEKLFRSSKEQDENAEDSDESLF